jgi:signal transduction histidine kinase
MELEKRYWESLFAMTSLNLKYEIPLNFPANSITVLDKTGKIVAFNRLWNPLDDSCNKISDDDNNLEVFRSAAEDRKVKDGIKSVIDGLRHTFEMDYEYHTSSGQRYFRMTVTPRLDGGGGAIVSNHDITERKLDEQRMLELSSQLIKAQEKERSRIARELHDDLNQRLALLSLEMDQLGQEPPGSADEFRRRMHDLWNAVRLISVDINRIAYQLHPSKLDTLGLVPALSGLCNEISKRHLLSVEFTNDNIPESLSGDVGLCIFRIVQEALSNVIKHSGAHKARVELSGGAQIIQLRIADAGKGFEIATVKERGGLGLISMQERIRLVGGEMSIKSEPLCGTQIDVQIPLTTKC